MKTDIKALSHHFYQGKSIVLFDRELTPNRSIHAFLDDNDIIHDIVSSGVGYRNCLLIDRDDATLVMLAFA